MHSLAQRMVYAWIVFPREMHREVGSELTLYHYESGVPF